MESLSPEQIRKEIKVVFMGTPSFAVPILEGLIEHYHVIMVVCQPDRKKDRREYDHSGYEKIGIRK